MELSAATNGLRLLEKPENFEQAVLYTDSEYVIKCSRGIKRGQANRFFVEELHEEMQRIREVISLRFEHVPAHAGDVHNERAHELAFAEYQKGLSNAGVTGEPEFKVKIELDRRKKEALASKAEEWLAQADRTKWRLDCIENVEKFQDPGARFYPFVIHDLKIDTKPTVRVGNRPAYLLAVREGFCHVSFEDERRWNTHVRSTNKWKYGDMQLIPHEEVLPL
jgi:hypothetical protein